MIIQVLFKFLDFSMHGIFYRNFPGVPWFPEFVGTRTWLVLVWPGWYHKDRFSHDVAYISATMHSAQSKKDGKNTINITNKSQEVSPFPAGDHKAAMNRR